MIIRIVLVCILLWADSCFSLFRIDMIEFRALIIHENNLEPRIGGFRVLRRKCCRFGNSGRLLIPSAEIISLDVHRSIRIRPVNLVFAERRPSVIDGSLIREYIDFRKQGPIIIEELAFKGVRRRILGGEFGVGLNIG